MRRSSSRTCCRSWSRWAWSSILPRGEGPVIYNPVRAPADVDRVVELEDLGALDFVFETVRRTRADLPGEHSADRLCRGAVHAGQLRDRRGQQPQLPAHQDADVPRRRRLADADGAAGAVDHAVSQRPDRRRRQCVQLFDSWVGCLGAGRLPPLRAAVCEADHRRPHARRAGDQLRHRQSGAACRCWPKRAAT